MVNWEQVINEMELPGLRDDKQQSAGTAYVSDGNGGWKKLEGSISFEMDPRATDLYREMLPPLDNDTL